MATSTAEATAAGPGSGNQVATASPSPSMVPRELIDMRRIEALATRASSMVEQIRGRLLAPEARKISPLYSAAQVAALCGVDKAHVNYRTSKGDLPSGRLTPTGGKREFALAEVRRVDPVLPERQDEALWPARDLHRRRQLQGWRFENDQRHDPGARLESSRSSCLGDRH